MFEYLMPLLVMPTLREHAARPDLPRRRANGRSRTARQRGVPWGISESGYNAVDASLNYQYRAFGVPGPRAEARACRGPRDRAVRIGARADGRARSARAQPAAARRRGPRRPVRLLRGDRLHARAAAARADERGRALVHGASPGHEPARARATCCSTARCRGASSRIRCSRRRCCCCRSAIPQVARVLLRTSPSSPASAATRSDPEVAAARHHDADTPIPEVQLLSNGRYHVMVTNAGGGSSRWNDLAVTRWREDATCDHWGTFCYLRDVASGEFWSTAHQPTRPARRSLRGDLLRRRAPNSAAATTRSTRTPRSPSRPRTTSSCAGSRIINRSRVRGARSRSRATPKSSWRAPAADVSASRVQQPLRADRDRSGPAGDPLHAPAALARRAGAVDVSPDGRARRDRRDDLVRNRPRCASSGAATRRRTAGACATAAPLSGSEGAVLDPIVAIRHPDHARAGASRDDRHGLRRGRDPRCRARPRREVPGSRALPIASFDLAWTHAQVVLRQINATEADAQLYARLAKLDPLRECVAARRCGRHLPATGAGSPDCGATRFPAIFRSCCCRSPTPAISISCGSWCRRMRTGG